MPALRALVLGACCVLGVAEASAYVSSTTTQSQVALRWMNTRCIFMRPSDKGSDDVPALTAVVQAIRQASENWHAATSSCSYMRFTMLDAAPIEPGFDKLGRNENAVVWIESGWKHDREAAAITTVFFIDKPGTDTDGRILDADIELNGQHFKFTTDPATRATDIQNTVTHELGHVLGLDHPCDDGARQPVPKDDKGQALPKCFPVAQLPQSMRDSTMFNFAEPGETKKRAPKEDDVRGVCTKYPTASAPEACEVVDLTKTGCAVGAMPLGEHPVEALVTLALWIGLLLVFGRRPR